MVTQFYVDIPKNIRRKAKTIINWYPDDREDINKLPTNSSFLDAY